MTGLEFAAMFFGPIKNSALNLLRNNPLLSADIAEGEMTLANIYEALDPAIQLAVAEKKQQEMDARAADPERMTYMEASNARLAELERLESQKGE